MKNLLIIIIALLISFSTYSCKKDFASPEAIIQDDNPFVPQFYVRGVLEDLVNNQEIVLQMDSSAIDLTPENIFDGSNVILSNSGLGEHSTTGTKFITSYTGFSEHTSSSFHGIDADRAVDFARLGIGVTLVSDVPKNEVTTKFTREELLPLLQEGTTLSFGTEPGQVGIGFHQYQIEDYTPPFGYEGFIGDSSHSLDSSNSTFEILNVENYIQEGVINPEKGLLVTAKINCSLGYQFFEEANVLNLVDVEVLFFFEHS